MPSSPSDHNSIAAFVSEAAQRFGLPASWIDAVIHVESFGQTYAVSPKGAMGLMQIMPATWETLRVQYGLGNDPCDPHDNITAGTAYLRQMYDRFGYAGFLAAFNAGPDRYENFLAAGRPLPEETHLYLAKLGPLLTDKPIGGSLLANNDEQDWMRSSMFVGSLNISDQRATDIPAIKNMQANTVPTDRSIAQTFALSPPSSGLFVHDVEMGRRP